MAIATNRSVDLQYQPILGVRSVAIVLTSPEATAENESALKAQGVNAISVGLEFYNAGQVELTYSRKYMRVSFANRTSDDGIWLSRSGLILPGSSMTFRHPVIALDPPISSFPAKGRIDSEFEYYHNSAEIRKTLQANLEYEISPGPNGFVINWTFIDESSDV